MSDPLITVITAVRNGEKHVAETVESIRAQDCTNWEYLIVDDASTDGTVEIVNNFAAKDRRIKLVRRTEAGGPYTAANDALRISRGRYIMRTDADDLQPVSRFRRQVEFLRENPQFHACVTFWQLFNENGLVPKHMVTLPRPGAFKWYLLLRGASVHSSFCIERSVLEAMGGYRELPLSQDYRMLCDLTRKGVLGVVPEVLSYVRTHENQSTNKRGALQKQLARDVLQEHWQALTGTACSESELDTLWAIGYSAVFDIRTGLEMLDRWCRLWQADGSLEADDRKELEELTEFRKRKFLRSNLRANPVKAIVEGFKLVRPVRALSL